MLLSGFTCPICGNPVDPQVTQCPECRCVVQLTLDHPQPGDGTVVRPMVQAALDRSREQIGNNPRHGLAHYTLGLGYLNYGLVDQGLEELGQAALLLPEQHIIRWEIAVLFAQRGMHDAALDELRRALQLAPTNREYRYFEAVLNARLAEGRGETRQAVLSWIAAYNVAPELVPAREWLLAFVNAHAHKLRKPASRLSPNFSASEAEAVRVITTDPEAQAPSLPTAPKAIQEPSKLAMSLLRKMTPGRAAALEEMHAEHTAAYQQASSEYQIALREAQESRKMAIDQWKDRAAGIRNDLTLMARLCLAVVEAEEQQRREEELRREEQARRAAEAQERLRQRSAQAVEPTRTAGEAPVMTLASGAPAPMSRRTVREKSYHSTGARYLQGFPTGKAKDKGTLTVTNLKITFKHPGLLGGWEYAIPIENVVHVTTEKIKHMLSSETRLRLTYRNERGITTDVILDELNVDKCIKQILAAQSGR